MIYDRMSNWPMRKGNEKLSRNGGVHMILVACMEQIMSIKSWKGEET